MWHWTNTWNGWTGQHWAWTGSAIVGIGLMAWIILEVLIVPDRSLAASGLQLVFGMVGVSIVSLAAWRPVRHYYRRRPEAPPAGGEAAEGRAR